MKLFVKALGLIFLVPVAMGVLLGMVSAPWWLIPVDVLFLVGIGYAYWRWVPELWRWARGAGKLYVFFGVLIALLLLWWTSKLDELQAFSLWGLIAIVGFLWWFASRPVEIDICMRCGHKATPQRYTSGSSVVELILWLCGILPGLIYHVMRRRDWVCELCGSTELIPENSPRARAMTLARHCSQCGAQLSAAVAFCSSCGAQVAAPATASVSAR